jgi:hypothetical protein
LKTQTTRKAIPKVGDPIPAKKRWKAVLRAEEMVPALNEAIAPASDEKAPRMPYKVKFKLRDDINVERKKFEEEETGRRVAMWRSRRLVSKQGSR